MAPYLSELGHENALRIVRAGDEAILPLAPHSPTVRVTEGDAPDWALRIARNHGYTVEMQALDADAQSDSPTVAATE